MTPTQPTSACSLPCSILLLAGGRGSRMGGQDKGLVAWRGQPLIAHVQAVVRPLSDDLIISCNRNAERYRAYADRLVEDGQKDFPGPLAGVLAGLATARHPWLLVLACDAPQIDAALIQALLDARGNDTRPVMVQQAGQWQPMFSLIPTALLGDLRQAWDNGERSLLRALAAHGLRPLPCAADDPRLSNFNTPELLSEAGPKPLA
ncbi:molybdenum cofactor guanylyltransferase MobA [Pseudomonas protegens]|uniref:Molybdenum cofactor guanylyltransferase n=1 Tax=Pseudomonas protegens (strain DSM 19095 / LMG 27888 / CFBP 6595 / CHA0) TaxID=1124983 RepID=A0A2C9EPD9_PSEPH|nr:molybdenum cofactor guanylyltransferase MobA [Pseudomonas protegens]AGL85534.1 putative molybdopterin-guanine dinucleotide biosynthesis protein A [Pseudomonas protegens CHA0]MBP5113840.1 molybdenum cofactor guanylyltransferase MobA [Pseudomonas protegens]QTU28713.1 molybdenum cofactor guanylyltransferase MobA [Pseudomonas protegens]QTU34956.1 molybdenum cofactor guanylyltransferase MobA [Pseudomonas protegens]VAV70046.1 molybdopterin-guanine dinucleotide biosynthesis protein A [Pseudomonas 